MADLKRCPFCGSKAEMVRHGTARASMIISCGNCGATVESGDVVGLTKPSEYAWNQRVAKSLSERKD